MRSWYATLRRWRESVRLGSQRAAADRPGALLRFAIVHLVAEHRRDVAADLFHRLAVLGDDLLLREDRLLPATLGRRSGGDGTENAVDVRRRPSGGERLTCDREYRVRALERDACDERAGLGERERGDAFRHEDLPLERDNRGTDATEPNARSSPASSERSVREFGSTYTRFRGVEVGFDRVPAREDNVVVDVRRVESTLVSTEPRVDAAEQAEVSTDREVGRTETKEDREDIAEVGADRDERATDHDFVDTDRCELAKDRAAHGTDRSAVETDRCDGATERGSHRPDPSVLEKELSTDETDQREVATDRLFGRAGRRVVETDRRDVVTES